MSRMKNIFSKWLPLALVVTAFCLLAYVTVQQSLRQGANDPQIQMAEDAAAALQHGASADLVISKAPQVEMSTSLAPFLIVFDGSGKAVASSGLLNGTMPDYPIGALNSSKTSGENRVTWQPGPDVRIASVVVRYDKGFVVSGRSLREVEKREAQTQTLALVVWLLTLVAVLVVTTVLEFILRPSS
jgi:hypothetical protein